MNVAVRLQPTEPAFGKSLRDSNRIELSPYGIHWPELDEDLSFQGLLRGDYSQHQKAEPERGANESQPS